MDDTNSRFTHLLQSTFPEHAANLILNSSLLQLGGDSLMAAALAAKIHRIWGIRIAVREILQAHRLAEIFALLPSQVILAPVPAVNIEVGLQFSQSPAQAMIYLEHFRNPHTTAYNIPIVAHIPHAISQQSFSKALQEVASQLPVLFAKFGDEDGKGFFRAEACTDILIQRFDSIDQASVEFVRPFSLARDVLLRAAIVPFDGRQTSLLFDFSHIVADGVSVGYFIEQFKLALHGQTVQAEARSSFDFSRWQQSTDYQEQHAQDRQFWAEALHAVTAKPAWPADRRVAAGSQFGYALCRANIDSELALQLRDQAKQSNSTPFSLVLLSYFLLQAHLQGRWNSHVGVVVSGRTEPAFFGTFGMFVNTLILPIAIAPESTVTEAIAYVSRHSLKALEHQTFPLAEQVQLTGARTEDGTHPLLDALFAFQNIDYQKIDVFGGRFGSFCAGKKMAQFALVIQLFDLAAHGYEIQWEYCPQRFDRGTVATFIAIFLRILKRLAHAGSEQTLARLLTSEHTTTNEQSSASVADFDFGG